MLNTAVIMGRLTADPELRQTPNGVSVTSFTVACDRNYSSRSGGERPCDFIDVVAWRQTAEFVCKYFSKGSMSIVQGSIQTRMYQDRNGNNRKAVEIQADNCMFGESKRSSSAPSTDNSYAPRAAVNTEPAPAYQSGSADSFEEIPMDDDLPF